MLQIVGGKPLELQNLVLLDKSHLMQEKFTADRSNREICWNNLFPLTQMLQGLSFTFSDLPQRRAGSPVNVSQQNVSEVHGYVPWWPNMVQPQKLRQITAFQAILSESSFWTLATGSFFNLKPRNIKEQNAST